MTFRLLTYNVLAAAFTAPEYYPNSPIEALAKERRYALTVERVENSAADIICLQEVEVGLWELLLASLTPLGYEGCWSTRSDVKPDGCATLWRTSRFSCTDRAFRYRELPETKLAHRMARLDTFTPIDGPDDGAFTVANTHLAWEQPTSPSDTHLGLIEVHQLVELLGSPCGPLIVCGDFNAEPGGVVLDFLNSVGLRDSHRTSEPTFASQGHVKKIDHLMATDDFEATPLPIITHLEEGAAMPSLTEPSDHLPLVTDFVLKR